METMRILTQRSNEHRVCKILLQLAKLSGVRSANVALQVQSEYINIIMELLFFCRLVVLDLLLYVVCFLMKDISLPITSEILENPTLRKYGILTNIGKLLKDEKQKFLNEIN